LDGTNGLQIDPIEGLPLIRALHGSWYYAKDKLGNIARELPKKNHPHSDVGDSFCYLLSRCSPSPPKLGPERVETTWNPWNPPTDYTVTDDVPVESDFSIFSNKFN
jgi:hypothetical protein